MKLTLIALIIPTIKIIYTVSSIAIAESLR